MEIIVDKNAQGTLKLSTLVVRKLIYMLLKTDNYDVNLADIDVSILENNNIIAQIKLDVDCHADLVSLKNTINKMILKRVNSVLNSVLLNTHLLFSIKAKQ